MSKEPPRRHPSGRPVHKHDEQKLGFPRYGYDDYLTPRLRRYAQTPAIGFTARLTRDDDEESNHAR